MGNIGHQDERRPFAMPTGGVRHRGAEPCASGNGQWMSNDEQDTAESFDEDLLVDEGDDDTDVASQYPPDHYEGVLDPAVTEAGDARVETIQERVLREEPDPVVDALDRDAQAEEAEDAVQRHAFEAGASGADAIDAELAEIEDAALDND